MRWPDSLQNSLQYFPYAPSLGTTHTQLGWAHLFVSAMFTVTSRATLRPVNGNHKPRVPLDTAPERHDDQGDPAQAQARIKAMCERLLANPVIEPYTIEMSN